MNLEPKVGEVITFDYQRYKTVETNDRQMGRECQTYCALAEVMLTNDWPACGVVRCSPKDRKDGKFVNFVKMAPRKRRHTL